VPWIRLKLSVHFLPNDPPGVQLVLCLLISKLFNMQLSFLKA
jgi:hypothetical protein